MSKILVEFGGVGFRTAFEENPTEEQFEVAGRELVAIAAMMRTRRLDEQMKLAPQTGGAVAAPSGTPAQVQEQIYHIPPAVSAVTLDAMEGGQMLPRTIRRSDGKEQTIQVDAAKRAKVFFD